MGVAQLVLAWPPASLVLEGGPHDKVQLVWGGGRARVGGGLKNINDHQTLNHVSVFTAFRPWQRQLTSRCSSSS